MFKKMFGTREVLHVTPQASEPPSIARHGQAGHLLELEFQVSNGTRIRRRCSLIQVGQGVMAVSQMGVGDTPGLYYCSCQKSPIELGMKILVAGREK